MEDKNILTEGLEALITIKENLLELHGYQEKSRQLSEEETRLDNEITEKEKQINIEIEALTKKRKEEMIASFDDQLNKTESRIKKVKARKEKFKDTKVSERVKLETKDLVEERVLLTEEIKEIYKLERISKIFNNQVFYALYMPCSFKDICIIILTVLLIAVALPFGIYNYFLGEHMAWLIITYIIVLGAAAAIYIFIKKATKDKHKGSFVKIKGIRSNLSVNKKKTNEMKKAIMNDKDESSYGLEKFEEEINELEEQKKGILDEQKKALAAFEITTKNVIAESVWQNYKKEMDELKQKHDRVYEEEKNTENISKEFAIEIAKKYETYVGKEMLELKQIDELIGIMEAGGAETINEAIQAYKKQGESTEVAKILE